jgi:hypothetical protein
LSRIDGPGARIRHRGPRPDSAGTGAVLDAIRNQIGGADLVAGGGVSGSDGVGSLLREPDTAMVSTEWIAADTGNWR